MARTGMTDLIATLRGMTDAGTADYTIGTVNYWNDDLIQGVMDLHRTDFQHVMIESNPTTITGNALEYKEFIAPYQNLEAGSLLYIQDGNGGTLGTALFDVDYTLGIITFASDTAGSLLYLTGRSFNMNASAADVWRRKAANAARMFDFSTDNHSVKRSQFMQHCNLMAATYSSQGGIQTADLIRSDLT